MLIRKFAATDLEVCIELGSMMHQESVFRNQPFSRDRLALLAHLCLTNPDYICFVAERHGQVIGLMVGISGYNFFADSKYAADLALYVAPQHRGSTAAVRLVIEFSKWAEASGCNEMRCGVTTGINDELGGKIYRRFGFVDGGSLYVKQISPL